MIHSSPCETSPLAMIIDPRLTLPGDYATSVAGLSLFRRDQPAAPAACMVEPSLILVARGEKRLWVGGEGYSYDPSGFMVTLLDLPANSEVLTAPLRIDDLTARVQMSAATFHHHFCQLIAVSRECAARHPKPSLMDKRTSASTGAVLHHRL
jgi:hypothetical protein